MAYELTIRAVPFAEKDSRAALLRRLKDRLKLEQNEANPDIEYSRWDKTVEEEIHIIDSEVKNIADILEHRVHFDGIRETLKTRLAHYFDRCTRALEVAELEPDLKDLDQLQALILRYFQAHFSPIGTLQKVQSELLVNIARSLSNLSLSQNKSSRRKTRHRSPRDSSRSDDRNEKESSEEGAVGRNPDEPRFPPRKLKSTETYRERLSDSEEVERYVKHIKMKKSNRVPPRLQRSDSDEDWVLPSDSDSSVPTPRRRERRSRHDMPPPRRGRPVSDWNLWYDGKDNGQGLMRFIREIEFTANSENMSQQELFRSAINLFRGPAKTWFMSGIENEEFASWKQLVREMKNEFLSPDHDHVSEMRAIARKQGPKEKFQNYLIEMQKIFNGFTKSVSEKRKFQIIFRNMRSDYRGYAIASKIDNLADLKTFGRQLDATFWYKFQAVDESPRVRSQVNEIRTGAKPKTRDNLETTNQKSRYFYGSSKSEPWKEIQKPKQQYRGSEKSSLDHPRRKNSTPDGLEVLLSNYLPLPEGRCYNCRLPGHHYKDYLVQSGYQIVNPTDYVYSDGPEVNELILNLENDSRPFAKVTIFGLPLIGLLDSGANKSILGQGAEHFIQICRLKVLPVDLEVVTANGQNLKVLGYVSTPVTFNDSTKLIDLLVIPSLKQKLILGADFWVTFGIVPSLLPISVDEVECSQDVFQLSPEQQNELEEVKGLFKIAVDDKLDATPLITHRIELTEEAKSKPPVRINPFPVSPKRQVQINDELDRMLECGIIERSYSDWSLRLVPVDKADGTVRLCIDARKLNELTVRDSYPLPHADRILSRLGPSRFISTIDLSKAFLQVPLHPRSKKFTAFAVLGRGFFQFRRMPYGLVNSPATLARLMDRILGGGELEPFVFVYLDDIIVVSDTFGEHLARLREVASRLNMANLSINISKSKFCVSEVGYLGYILSPQGLRPNPERVDSIVNYERPKSLRAVRRFLGMCNYYRRFIENFSAVVQPLTDLLKGKPTSVKWNDLAEVAFVKIKELLISTPILANPDFSRPFCIHCDASDLAIAGVLTQFYDTIEKPVAYFSQKLGTTQQRYCATEKEALAVLKSVEKFRCYVEGSKFTVYTDASALTYILRSSWRTSSRLCRWSIELQRYDFEIKHRRGSDNIVPDALSRAVEELHVSPGQPNWYLSMVAKMCNSKSLSKIMTTLYI
ncbi:uncharacterized protein LOC129737854 [Uranotaenia lowii]|uniref:uncharacterized protein LOC129737854 n=1 Tax=Uranotaenia lowii TaxID=190385 RepID=UPI00247ABF08|nr:uncharacterized protein LOC129737854 [Uranotaenia lowii]